MRRVGKLRYKGKDSAQYTVESFKELKVIINHFNQYPLVTEKLIDFMLFKKCVNLIENREHLTNGGLLKIVGLKNAINWGLSDNLKKSFLNAILIERPNFVFKGIPDPFWVAGFTSGDGSFHIALSNKNNISLWFGLHLHIREQEVLKGLIVFFKSYGNNNVEDIKNNNLNNDLKQDDSISSSYLKNKTIDINEKSVNLRITKIYDLINLIIPFFALAHLWWAQARACRAKAKNIRLEELKL